MHYGKKSHSMDHPNWGQTGGPVYLFTVIFKNLYWGIIDVKNLYIFNNLISLNIHVKLSPQSG